MSLLALIWWSSLALAGAALFVMGLLVLSRLLTTHSRSRRAIRRRELVRQVLSGEGLTSIEDLRRLPLNLLAVTFVDLIRLVRGEERATFIAQATALGVPSYFERRLRRGSARERLLAAQALGEFADPRSAARLQTALRDANPEVRLAAALALAGSGDANSVREIVEELGLGKDEDSALAITLFRSLSADRIGQIKELVEDPDTKVQVRLAAIEALAMTGDYTIIPVIARLVHSSADDFEELPRYLRALGLFAHPAAAPAVLDGLNRATSAARAAAACAVGHIGLVEAVDRLVELLDDDEWWVRFRSAEALLRLGNRGIERLQQVSREGSSRASAAARAMLAENKLPA